MSGRWLAPFASVVLVLGGCQGPGLGAGFDAPDPAAQIHAALRAAKDGDRTSIPHLIDMLESEDQAARVMAISTLERFTGGRLGYDHAAPPRERGAMVARWRDWLRGHPTAPGKVAEDRPAAPLAK